MQSLRQAQILTSKSCLLLPPTLLCLIRPPWIVIKVLEDERAPCKVHAPTKHEGNGAKENRQKVITSSRRHAKHSKGRPADHGTERGSCPFVGESWVLGGRRSLVQDNLNSRTRRPYLSIRAAFRSKWPLRNLASLSCLRRVSRLQGSAFNLALPSCDRRKRR